MRQPPNQVLDSERLSFSVFRKHIRKVPMAGARQRWPKRTGGFTIYYPDEGREITASDLTLGMVTLTAKKWAMLTFVSQELDEDASIAVGELVGLEFALALAQAEETNGFMGDGTSNYAGIVGVFKSPNVAAVTMDAAKTSFNDLAPKNLVQLITTVPGWAKKADPAYYASPDVVGIIMQMVDTSGRPIYSHPNEGFPGRVNGYPVRESSALPGLGEDAISTGFLAFGSLFLWGMLGIRRSMTIARSDEVRFLADQIAIKGVARQDIQEADGEAMAILKTAAA